MKILPCFMIFNFMIFSLTKNNFIVIIFYLLGLIVFSLFAPQKYKFLHSNMKPQYRATILSIKSLLMALISCIVQSMYGYMSEIIGMSYSFFILLLASLLLLITNNVVFKKDIKKIIS